MDESAEHSVVGGDPLAAGGVERRGGETDSSLTLSEAEIVDQLPELARKKGQSEEDFVADLLEGFVGLIGRDAQR